MAVVSQEVVVELAVALLAAEALPVVEVLLTQARAVILQMKPWSREAQGRIRTRLSLVTKRSKAKLMRRLTLETVEVMEI